MKQLIAIKGGQPAQQSQLTFSYFTLDQLALIN